MATLIIPHGTPEWFESRLGRLTASRFHDAMTRIKGGFGASRYNYRSELVVERMTGVPYEHYTNSAMQRGNELEGEALAAYAFERDCDPRPGGFVKHPKIAWAGASPDAFVGEKGLVEIKCPNTNTHIDLLRGKDIPDRYLKQMFWQLACCPEREWCDFVSYDPRMDPAVRLFVERVPRDSSWIGEMEAEARAFLDEVDAIVHELVALIDRRRRAA